MVSAIIVAAGRGTRMGPSIDKLFLPLNGEKVVGHTWRRFDQSVDVQEVILVIRDGMHSVFEELGDRLRLKKPFRLVQGGAERQDSVWNGLMALPQATEIVAIQDGARPCTSLEVIHDTIVAAKTGGAAVAAQAVTDTIKESKDGIWVDRTLDRSTLWAVQTPQVFQKNVIVRALEEVRKRGLQVTDDTAACELIGQRVRLIVSAAPNPKVTRREDIPVIESLLRQQT